MKAVIFTSDTHAWLLRGFFLQWAKYGERPGGGSDILELEVAGFKRPGFLPPGVGFVSIGSMEDYPIGRWSDAVIKYLESISDDLVLILLEDYWMVRPVYREALLNAWAFMQQHPDVIRFDVAADRMFSREARYIGSFGVIDLCEAKGDYSLSFQASIYRRRLLLEVMQPGETPWQAELNGSTRLNRMTYPVFGSYQWPMNYMITVNKGQLDTAGKWMYPARTLSREDWQELANQGCLEAERL